MKLDVIKLDGGKAGSVELTDEIFDLEPRADILQRVVRWQRSCIAKKLSANGKAYPFRARSTWPLARLQTLHRQRIRTPTF